MEFMKMKNWKRQLCKKGAILGAAGILALGCSGTTVMANYEAHGELNGFKCYGKITTDRDSATAMTTFQRGGINIKADAIVYYHFGSKYYNTIMYSSNTASSTSAVAEKKVGGADVVGGKGTHSISYDSYSWNPKGGTTTGKIPSKSINKQV